ncbi:hypothetical protein [Steroidobacter cummioxidans]|uniref:hypothetical protein n=1 Tax=Steroidobacter cummioxidans TaxID=1803913 RepID=UPI00129061C3|nr:hypothetical protein [Steroidobacter cummioxidans]
MSADFDALAEKAVVLWWRIGGIGLIVLSSLGIFSSVLMLLVALLGSSDDRAGAVLGAVGTGAVSSAFMYLGIRLASATRRDLHDV